MLNSYNVDKNFDFLNFDFNNYKGDNDQINKMLYEINDKKIRNFLEKEATLCNNKNDITLYNSLIKLYSILINRIGIKNNPISYLILIRAFINSGIFSIKGDQFKVKCSYHEEFPGYMGLPIIYGYGSCRNISAFASDILTAMGIENKLLYGYISPSIPIFENHDANHVINVINYKDVYYGLDVSNGEIFYFLDEIRLKNLFRKQDVFFNNVPLTNLILTDLPIFEYSKELLKYKESSHKECISFEEFGKIISKISESIIANDDNISRLQLYKDDCLKKIKKY